MKNSYNALVCEKEGEVMVIDPGLKFRRVKKGYDPQEVDAVFSEFQRQVDDLKRTNDNIIRQYEEKIKLIEANTLIIEQERAKANQRLTIVLDKAVRVAEEIKQEAQQKADEIIRTAQTQALSISEKAQKDNETARNAFTSASQNVQAVSQTNRQFASHTETFLNEMEALLNDALQVISDTPSQLVNTPPKSTVSPEYTMSEPTAQQPNTHTAAESVPAVETVFDYESFLKNAGLNQNDSIYFQQGSKKIIGTFGEDK